MCHFSRPLPAQSSVRGIRNYDDFCHANDPYEEHDFGSFEADGHKIFFKIDYYDSPLIRPILPSLTASSPSCSLKSTDAGQLARTCVGY
jgi:hypothetical protein